MSPAGLVVLLSLVLGPAPADSTLSDKSLILNADFGGKVLQEAPPQEAVGIERAVWHVRRQLSGRDFYDPPNYIFFRQAVRCIGFIPALFATADRLLRDSRIGTAGQIGPDRPVIQEGPEAYAPGRAGR